MRFSVAKVTLASHQKTALSYRSLIAHNVTLITAHFHLLQENVSLNVRSRLWISVRGFPCVHL